VRLRPELDSSLLSAHRETKTPQRALGEGACSWALLQPIEPAHHTLQPTLLKPAMHVLAQFRVRGLCYPVGFRLRSTRLLECIHHLCDPTVHWKRIRNTTSPRRVLTYIKACPRCGGARTVATVLCSPRATSRT
jgi:hypothetical protein